MRLFDCSKCYQPVYFDNTSCVSCQNPLGYDPTLKEMVALAHVADGIYQAINKSERYRYCSNHQHDACNWLIPELEDREFCIACELNQTIPDISKNEFLERWKLIEMAKHRLVYALLNWDLPLHNKKTDAAKGLAFVFKSDQDMPDGQRVLTGHANGIITLNIAEADDVEREMARNQMDEVYRTVLGHFRHEIGHYYWDLLISDSPHLEKFRELYGDERQDYQDALNQHYAEGPSPNWQENFISAYASMHPWESWAETWAHYMHMIDTLETAYYYGLTIRPQVSAQHYMPLVEVKVNAYTCIDFNEIFQNWLSVSLMMNSLNRSMGHRDIYPFVVNATVKEKLAFIHGIIHQQKIS